ncbi:hypothetical protein COO60DRAFT_1482673 [Scenedesmus sp. NREL 46B-D3]|nr:hypothetical protein COO60DRAFT_1482673 [Scenedesmus sp. NREL 46B-D3]
MPGGSPRLLSRLLLARSKLRGGCSGAWCEACLRAMTAAPARLTVSSWVNALAALVRLRHAPGRAFQAVLFSSTASRLDDVSPEVLTNLAWSLARLQLQPSYLWWRSLVSATAGIDKAFSHGQLASLIHSVALWAEPGGIHLRDVQRLVDLLLVQVERQLALMQPGELTTILWSLGSLSFGGKYVPERQVQDALLDAIQGQLPRLNPGQLASLCWGLAKLQHRLPEGFAEALLLEVQAQVQGFSNAGLANVTWALARLGLQPGVAFRHPLWEELHARCGSVSLQDLSTLLWALTRLSLQPPPDLLRELTQQSLTLLREAHSRLHTQDFTPSCHREGAELAEALAALVAALGQLHASPDAAWLEEVDGLSLLLLPRAGLPQLLCIVKGMQQLRQQPPAQAWQACCLREVRLRCRCSGVELDCASLAQLLAEVGVVGLADGVAAAEQSFSDEENALNGYCAVEFQSGCR